VPDSAPEARRPETEILLACARTHASSADQERIRRLAGGPVDWAAVEILADAHGVLPLLAQRLEAHASQEVSAAVRSRLRQRMLTHAVRCLVLTRALVDLLTALSERGVPALPYKGPALAAVAYGSPVLRQPGDLDILVPGDQLAIARAVLLRHGYHDQLAGIHPDARPSHYQHTMIRDADGVVVELHWAFAPRYFRFPLGLGALGREPLLLDSRRVDTIVPADLLVVLCVHGGRHLWSRLGWVADIAELLRARPEVEWGDALGRATTLGVRRMLLVGLALARETLGAELPEVLERALSPDRATLQLARRLEAQLFPDQARAPALTTTARLHLAMRERWRDRAAYALLGAITPSERDAPELAHGSQILRAAVRPLRLLREHGPWRRRR
jgi:putative nucleotidyltransferase-like protein